MEFNPMNSVVLVLTTIVGISVVTVFASSFLRFFIAIVVLVLVFQALEKGRSDWFEQITFNLGRYFASEPFGLTGVVLGILIGTALYKKRR